MITINNYTYNSKIVQGQQFGKIKQDRKHD